MSQPPVRPGALQRKDRRATFFAKTVLPRLTAERKIIEAVDLTIMDLGEDSF